MKKAVVRSAVGKAHKRVVHLYSGTATATRLRWALVTHYVPLAKTGRSLSIANPNLAPAPTGPDRAIARIAVETGAAGEDEEAMAMAEAEVVSIESTEAMETKVVAIDTAEAVEVMPASPMTAASTPMGSAAHPHAAATECHRAGRHGRRANRQGSSERKNLPPHGSLSFSRRLEGTSLLNVRLVDQPYALNGSLSPKDPKCSNY
jgi:hypothetical protein